MKKHMFKYLPIKMSIYNIEPLMPLAEKSVPFHLKFSRSC
jgi:hypothetical protein